MVSQTLALTAATTVADCVARRWDFAVRNNVQLKDEYDQIHHDMAPHWAL